MKKNISIFFTKKPLKMLCLGFSSGLPILLIFSTLSVWLVKAGVSRSTVTLFSWAGFAYAFKYLWSPLVDNYKLPILKKFGHRRSWLLLSQFLIIIALILTAFTDPKESLFFTALFITILAFFSATQDILIDAFRIESAPQSLQGPLSSMYIAGYRVAMLEAIKYIDTVLTFDTRQELEDLVEMYSPDILLLGDDWRDGEVVGAEFAKEVRFLPRVGGYASSSTISKIKNL